MLFYFSSQIVCPVDGYVTVGKDYPDELIVLPVEEELEGLEIIISHVMPNDFVLDIDEDEREYGKLVRAGAIIGIS